MKKWIMIVLSTILQGERALTPKDIESETYKNAYKQCMEINHYQKYGIGMQICGGYAKKAILREEYEKKNEEREPIETKIEKTSEVKNNTIILKFEKKPQQKETIQNNTIAPKPQQKEEKQNNIDRNNTKTNSTIDNAITKSSVGEIIITTLITIFGIAIIATKTIKHRTALKLIEFLLISTLALIAVKSILIKLPQNLSNMPILKK
jgi:DNA-directed RNA polymerase beta' subunit